MNLGREYYYGLAAELERLGQPRPVDWPRLPNGSLISPRGQKYWRRRYRKAHKFMRKTRKRLGLI